MRFVRGEALVIMLEAQETLDGKPAAAIFWSREANAGEAEVYLPGKADDTPSATLKSMPGEKMDAFETRVILFLEDAALLNQAAISADVSEADEAVGDESCQDKEWWELPAGGKA